MQKPPVLYFACPRTTDDTPKPFFYDDNLNLNLIDINGSNTPFIDAPLSSSELLTKTKMEREKDDEQYQLLELMTKTEAPRERDDR